jgi:hypothetical protein
MMMREERRANDGLLLEGKEKKTFEYAIKIRV